MARYREDRKFIVGYMKGTELLCVRMQYLLDITTKAFIEYCQICKILWGKASDLYHSKCASVDVKLLTSVLSLKMLN